MRMKILSYYAVAIVAITLLVLFSGCKDYAQDKEIHFKKAMVYIEEGLCSSRLRKI